jgi:hypothetical protein
MFFEPASCVPNYITISLRPTEARRRGLTVSFLEKNTAMQYIQTSATFAKREKPYLTQKDELSVQVFPPNSRVVSEVNFCQFSNVKMSRAQSFASWQKNAR